MFTYFFLVFLPVLRQNFVKFTNKSLKNCLKFNISSQKFEFIESKFTELVTPDIKIETLGSDIVKNFKNEFINIFKNKRARIKANILRFKKTCQSHEIDEKLSEWYSEVSIIQIEKSKKAVVNLKIKIVAR